MKLFNVIFSYPILHFCGRASFISIAGWDQYSMELSNAEVKTVELKRRVLVTIVWFLTALALSISVPNISDVISVIGALAAFFILIFPGMVIMQLVMDDQIRWWKR
jgi:cobalamin synthase